MANALAADRTYITPSDIAGVAIHKSPIELVATLAKSKGRVAGPRGAAAKLGIPPSTLESKIKQLGILKRQFITAS